jgi:hypothetical protein
VGANDRPVEPTLSRDSSTARDGAPDRAARVHIDAVADIVVDLSTDDALATGDDRLVVTTDIRCPNCGGTLQVDDFDRGVMAAQLSCIDCGFSYLQRLRHERPAHRRPLPHRKLREDQPVDLRSPEERERTIRAGADYFFWSG